jgi:drug/metabolite transporter (DMT)-like permease
MWGAVRGGAVEEDRERRNRVAVLMTLAASLMYGSQYVVIKEGIGAASPLLFGALTMTIGGILAFLIVRRHKRLDPRIFRRWEVYAGTLAAVGLISFQYVGLTLSSASVGGLIVGSNVIFVAPLSALLFREVIGRWQVAAVVLGLLGLVTITTNWNLSVIGSSAFVGNLLLLGASLSIAASYPLTRLAVRNMDNDEWVMAFHLLSGPVLAALMVMTGGPGDPSSMSIPALLYVGILCTSVPTILWAIGLRSLSMTTSATILMSESVFAVLLGAILLDEPLGLMNLLGAAMVFVAIFLAAFQRR